MEMTFSQSLSLARQQLNSEYLEKATSDLEKWIIDAEKEWREKGVKLPYPSFNIYPNENEIDARAEKLRIEAAKIKQPLNATITIPNKAQ
ncbi:MAG: hypothetical protein EBU90_17975 [Proteobacteria bacterium]|jgi:hypothetical protein|nr:hypothetical protein [Pseudomonadota bacterium]NBP15418.1 hypothetical protein [bacterium]